MKAQEQSVLIRLLTDTQDENIVRAVKYVLYHCQKKGDLQIVCKDYENKKKSLTLLLINPLIIIVYKNVVTSLLYISLNIFCV